MCGCTPLHPFPYKFRIRPQRPGFCNLRPKPRIRGDELSQTVNGRFLPFPANSRHSNPATTPQVRIRPVIVSSIADSNPRIGRNKPSGIISRRLLGISKHRSSTRTRSSSYEISDNSGDNKATPSGDEKEIPSSFDFLELKRELEKEESGTGDLKEDELIPVEGLGKTDLDFEEVEGGGGGALKVRGGRQVMKRSSLLAKQVISIQSARSLGFVSQLWIDTRSWVAVLVEVRPNLLSGEIEKFLLEDVIQVGDVVLVQDESVMENELKTVCLDTLVGYNVVTSGRRNVGKVRGYSFNINSGAVESLELDSFGFSIIPASLVSTYCLFVEDVLEVASDTVVVHEGAISRVQRLTKGIWDNRNVDKSGDEMEEYYDFGRQRVQSVQSQSSRNFRGRKFPRKMRVAEDDWELPMDY